MIVDTSNNQKRISIDSSTFAKMVDRTDDDYVFEFKYQVKQLDAVRDGITKVKISVLSKLIDRPDIKTVSGNEKVTSAKIVSNIKQHESLIHKYKQQVNETVLCQIMSDVTSKIDNRIVNLVREHKDIDISKLNLFYKTSLKLRSKLITKELKSFGTAANSSNELTSLVALNKSPRDIVKTLLMDEYDYSSILDFGPDRLSAKEIFDGTKKSRSADELSHVYDENDRQNLQINLKNVFGISTKNDRISYEIVNEPSDVITVASPSMLIAKKSVVNSTNVYVKFDVYDSNNLIVESTTHSLDVSKHEVIFDTPFVLPKLNFGKINDTMGNLAITKCDEKTKKVIVLRKIVSKLLNTQTQYMQVGTYNVSNWKTVDVNVPISPAEINIFRVIPVGANNRACQSYSNFVVYRDRAKRYSYANIVVRQDVSSVIVDVTGFSPSVTSFRILRRNRTQYQKEWIKIGGSQVSASDFFTYQDKDLRVNNTYEYAVEVIHDDDISEIVDYDIIEFVDYGNASLVQTVVENTNVIVNEKADVRFDIVTTFLERNTSIVKSLLEKNNLSYLFTDNLLEERDKLREIIAYDISRIDMETGRRETFGIVTSQSFVDSVAGKISGVSELELGKRYRYDIIPCLRKPESMLTSAIRNEVDEDTRRRFTVQADKFSHPALKKYGSIIDSRKYAKKYGKSEMSLGNIGQTCCVNVQIKKESVYVKNHAVSRLTDRYMLVEWDLVGNAKFVDGFIVLAVENGNTFPCGRVHTNSDSNHYVFIYELLEKEIGTFQFKIIPVYNDYQIGNTTVTESIQVDNV